MPGCVTAWTGRFKSTSPLVYRRRMLEMPRFGSLAMSRDLSVSTGRTW